MELTVNTRHDRLLLLLSLLRKKVSSFPYDPRKKRLEFEEVSEREKIEES